MHLNNLLDCQHSIFHQLIWTDQEYNKFHTFLRQHRFVRNLYKIYCARAMLFPHDEFGVHAPQHHIFLLSLLHLDHQHIPRLNHCNLIVQSYQSGNFYLQTGQHIPKHRQSVPLFDCLHKVVFWFHLRHIPSM